MGYIRIVLIREALNSLQVFRLEILLHLKRWGPAHERSKTKTYTYTQDFIHTSLYFFLYFETVSKIKTRKK
jgi:hypothetical protein